MDKFVFLIIIVVGTSIALSFLWLIIKKGIIDPKIRHTCDICHGDFPYTEWLEGDSYRYSCCRKCFEKTYQMNFDTLKDL